MRENDIFDIPCSNYCDVIEDLTFESLQIRETDKGKER